MNIHLVLQFIVSFYEKVLKFIHPLHLVRRLRNLVKTWALCKNDKALALCFSYQCFESKNIVEYIEIPRISFHLAEQVIRYFTSNSSTRKRFLVVTAS